MDQSQYRIRHLIPMFIGTPCTYIIQKMFMRNQNIYFNHRLIKITDMTLDVVFSRCLCVLFTEAQSSYT